MKLERTAMPSWPAAASAVALSPSRLQELLETILVLEQDHEAIPLRADAKADAAGTHPHIRSLPAALLTATPVPPPPETMNPALVAVNTA